jgi:hypothetical protein
LTLERRPVYVAIGDSRIGVQGTMPTPQACYNYVLQCEFYGLAGIHNICRWVRLSSRTRNIDTGLSNVTPAMWLVYGGGDGPSKAALGSVGPTGGGGGKGTSGKVSGQKSKPLTGRVAISKTTDDGWMMDGDEKEKRTRAG